MIKPKVPNIKTSVFAVMSKMAAEYDAVNLSQGFPNFDISEELSDFFTGSDTRDLKYTKIKIYNIIF